MKYAIIVAAGNSSRYGKDKLNEQLLGKSVLQHSVDVFNSVADVVVVVGQQIQGALYAQGGDSRFQSVLNGVRALPNGASGLVAIHDGARPFVSREFVERLYTEASTHGSAVPRLSVTDTTYQQDSKGVTRVDRNTLFTVQTPQVYDVAKISHALNHASGDYTDESSLYLDVYGEVNFVEGLRSNVKVTYPADLPQYKVGVGYDVHPFTEGNGVVLGGVTIPFDKKLQGYSNADALCHAICDAILSASGNLDIGHQFPDTDERYRNADSTKLLAHCVTLANSSGYEVVNVSAVVICQAPKIAPYIDQMATCLADILKVAPGCVNLSATTTEHLGTIGNGDGIAVSAHALLRRL